MKKTYFVAALALFTTVSVVHAQGINVDVSARGSAQSDAVSADVDTDVRANGTTMRSATGTDASREARDDRDDNETSMRGGVSVAAGDVDGLTAEERASFLATVKTHAQVRSGQDLENFAKGILLRDENVAEVSSDEDSVRVTYRIPAKFLGVFDATIPVDVVAEKAQGGLGAGVTAHFPWYRFLFGTAEETSETAIEADVQAAVAADLDGADALDASVAARVYAAIAGIMKTKHEAALNAIGNVR